MNLLTSITLFLGLSFSSPNNKPIDRLDPARYAGTWYSLYSIPTRWDKGSRETEAKYTWNASKNFFDVINSCKTEKGTTRTMTSKLFVPDSGNGALKVQFLWPFRVDYWIIELADDYSYVVVGHPDRHMLFIMSRAKTLSPSLYSAIVARCKLRGYDTDLLTSQRHEK